MRAKLTLALLFVTLFSTTLGLHHAAAYTSRTFTCTTGLGCESWGWIDPGPGFVQYRASYRAGGTTHIYISNPGSISCPYYYNGQPVMYCDWDSSHNGMTGYKFFAVDAYDEGQGVGIIGAACLYKMNLFSTLRPHQDHDLGSITRHNSDGVTTTVHIHGRPPD